MICYCFKVWLKRGETEGIWKKQEVEIGVCFLNDGFSIAVLN